MSTAAKPALPATSMRILLVGNKEEDYFLIRNILKTNAREFAADWTMLTRSMRQELACSRK